MPPSSSGSPTPRHAMPFLASSVIEELSNQLTPLASAIHAYDVTAALTYVKNGDILPHYQE